MFKRDWVVGVLLASPLALVCCAHEAGDEGEHDDEYAVAWRSVEQLVDGEVIERKYVVHTPLDWDSSVELPLIFAFHGGGGEGDFFVEDLQESMHYNPFIGIYPNAVEDGWNIGLASDGPDDVALVLSILDDLEGTAGMDTSHPVALGYSRGAAFVHTLATATDRFAGIGAMASQLRTAHQPQPEGAQVSVLQLHGTEDNVIEYEGTGEGEAEGEAFLGAEQSAAVWAAHNGCADTATEIASGAYMRMEWEQCDAGTQVVHYRLDGVGHDMPWDVEDDTFATIVNFLLDTRR
jgi:polyhydroxybutyrate depolymerase